MIAATSAALLLALAPAASARPSSSVETEYYSDASMTTQVGYRYLSCYGGTVRRGTTTAYAITFQEPC